MDWTADLPNWPLSEHSKQVQSAPHRWHVQDIGPENAPILLLLHGAGGSTHSFRDLIPLLIADFRIIAVDLPGQGFINAALDQFQGLAGLIFPVIAKLLALTPFTAQVFSKASANPARIQSLISSTGSNIGAEGLSLYQRLVADRDHVDGTLLMMAQWQLDSLQKQLPKLTAPVTLIACENDKAVPAGTSTQAAALMPKGSAHVLEGLGHLAHEEDATRGFWRPYSGT